MCTIMTRPGWRGGVPILSNARCNALNNPRPTSTYQFLKDFILLPVSSQRSIYNSMHFIVIISDITVALHCFYYKWRNFISYLLIKVWPLVWVTISFGISNLHVNADANSSRNRSMKWCMSSPFSIVTARSRTSYSTAPPVPGPFNVQYLHYYS